MKRVSFGKRTRAERGATLVEFAVALPLFLLLVLAVFDFGHVVFQHSVLSQAHRVAGRSAAMKSEPGACLASAQTAYTDFIQGMLPRAVTASLSGRSTALAIPGGAFVNGYELEIQAPVACLFCNLLTGGAHSALDYNRRSFYPFDDQASGC